MHAPSRAAYHEAGHAVAAFVAGGSIRELVLFGDGGGQCRLHEPGVPLDLFAGGIAERIAYGSIEEWAWAQDRARAEGQLRRAGQVEPAAVLADAERVVRDGWPAVQELAGELERRRTMPGHDAESIIIARLPEQLLLRAQIATLRRGLERVMATLQPILAKYSTPVEKESTMNFQMQIVLGVADPAAYLERMAETAPPHLRGQLQAQAAAHVLAARKVSPELKARRAAGMAAGRAAHARAVRQGKLPQRSTADRVAAATNRMEESYRQLAVSLQNLVAEEAQRKLRPL